MMVVSTCSVLIVLLLLSLMCGVEAQRDPAGRPRGGPEELDGESMLSGPIPYVLLHTDFGQGMRNTCLITQ